MKKILVSSFLVMAVLGGCKNPPPTEIQPLCNIMFATVTGAAQGVGQALECANIPAIAADLSAPLQKLTLCEAGQQGVMADAICPKVVEFVMGFGVAALPEKWACKGGKITESATKALTDACTKNIKF